MAVYSISYPGSTQLTITASGLAGDTNASGICTGVQSNFVTNASNLYIDYILSGSFGISTGTATNKQFEVWLAGADNATSTTFTAGLAASATGATIGITPTEQKFMMVPALVAPIGTATAQVYRWNAGSVAQKFGGVLPQKFVVFFGHSSNGTISTGTTATGFFMQVDGVRYTSA